MGTPRSSRPLARRWGALALALAASSSLSCTFVFDSGERQCEVDADCADRGFVDSICDEPTRTCRPKPAPPPDPKWGCIDQAPTTTNALVDVKLRVVDPNSQSIPRRDAKVRACAALDPQCTRPVVNFVDVDEAGEASLRVSDSFDGYFEIVSKEVMVVNDVEKPTFVPTLASLPTRTILSSGSGRGVLVFDDTTLQLLSLAADGSKPYDPESGLVVLSALDCQSELTAGVSYQLIGDSRLTSTSIAFYTTDSNVPDKSLTETGTTGNGGFTNLSEGTLSVDALVNLLQKKMRQTPFSTTVRKGWVHEIFLAP